MPSIYKTIFKKEINCDFLPPSRVIKHIEVEVAKTNKNPNLFIEVMNAKIIIIACGAPGGPFKRSLMEYWSKKGYWVFNPRYRGTWESKGNFLQKEPTQDILDVMDSVSSGFKEGWHGIKFKVNNKKLFLFGGSFGGPAVLLASSDPRVNKVIAMCPVVEWKTLGPAETFEKFQSFTQEYFGQVYRGSKKDWAKLKDEKMYTPLKQIDQIDGSKILIIQTKDDESVPWRSVAKLAKKTKAQIKLYSKGGHLGVGKILNPVYLKQIENFIK